MNNIFSQKKELEHELAVAMAAGDVERANGIKNALHNMDPDSHKDHFEVRKPKLTLIGDDENPANFTGEIEQKFPAPTERDQKQKTRRVERLSEAVSSALVARVVDPSGDRVLKVSYKEFEKIRQDPEFQSFATYAQNLLYYDDGRPRPMPLRPLLQNEVGMYRGKIVFLKDAGPDDVGEGKYHSVGAAIGEEPDPFAGPAETAEARMVREHLEQYKLVKEIGLCPLCNGRAIRMPMPAADPTMSHPWKETDIGYRCTSCSWWSYAGESEKA